MQEQEPSVNDILSSIRQILSNKIEDENTDVSSSDTVNESAVSEVDEQEQALMQATDVYVLMPDMRVKQEGKTQGVSQLNRDSSNAASYEQLNEQPIVVDAQEGFGKSNVIEVKQRSQTNEMSELPAIHESDIKPMIHDWLDKNLPTLVERIVAEEVRRIFNKR